MRTLDIVKPLCTGFVCGAVLAVLAKPFKMEVRIGKGSFELSSKN